MRACSGVWVAHGSGSADRETVDAHDRVRVPPGEESYVLRRVWLTEEEERGYYYGFSNEGLWPLCHVAHTRPVFRAEDWEQYVRVNARFADAVCEEVDSDDPIVLVQDYHFALAPKMIRERLPRGDDHHVLAHPLAERGAVSASAHGARSSSRASSAPSIVGFHTQQHCNNFLESRRLVRRVPDRPRGHRRRAGCQADSRAPLSHLHRVARAMLEGCPSVADCRAVVRRQLGLPPDALHRRGRRPARLHEGYRRAPLGRRRAPRAPSANFAAGSRLSNSRRRAGRRSRDTVISASASSRSPRPSTPSGRAATTVPIVLQPPTTSRSLCTRTTEPPTSVT